MAAGSATDPRTTLAGLVGDVEDFADRHWGRAPLLRRLPEQEAREAGLLDLLPLDAVDALLTSSALRTPAYRLVKDGRPLPRTAYTRHATIAGETLTGLVDPAKALAAWDDGATVVLQGLHRYWRPVVLLCRDLELALGHPVQANAYVTPPGAQGFGRHTDDHDVLVVQTFGCKVWRIGGPGSTDDDDDDEVGFEPGTVVYLPAGTPHSARTESSVSGHVTIGVLRTTWRAALRDVVDRLLADQAFDRPLPAGHLDDPAGMAKALREHASALSARLADLDADTAAGDLAASFLTSRLPLMRGALADRVRLEDVTDATVVRRRRGAVCVVRDEGERLRLLLGDRDLRVPARLRPAVELLAAGAATPVAEVPLDPQSRVVLVRRLVREGLLEVLG